MTLGYNGPSATPSCADCVASIANQLCLALITLRHNTVNHNTPYHLIAAQLKSSGSLHRILADHPPQVSRWAIPVRSSRVQKAGTHCRCASSSHGDGYLCLEGGGGLRRPQVASGRCSVFTAHLYAHTVSHRRLSHRRRAQRVCLLRVRARRPGFDRVDLAHLQTQGCLRGA